MTKNSPDVVRLRKYLLAELDPTEQAQIEEEYFLNDDAFEQLGIAEDEFIDAYVAGHLGDAERDTFERRYLTTAARRERVAFARAMRAVSRRRASTDVDAVALSWWSRIVQWLSTPPAHWALAAASVLLIVATAWLGIERAQLAQTVASLDRQRLDSVNEAARLSSELERERRRADGLAAQQAASSTQPPPNGAAVTPLIATFTLRSGLSRSVAGGSEVRVQPGAALVRLTLPLDANTHPRYRAVLSDAAGDELWTQQGLVSRVDKDGASVVVDLPASVLSNRDYILTVSGIDRENRREELADFVFRVVGR